MRWCWPDFVRESVRDCRRSVRNWPLTKRVRAYSGYTENWSIRRWAKLAGWLTDSQEFSQVVRSSRKINLHTNCNISLDMSTIVIDSLLCNTEIKGRRGSFCLYVAFINSFYDLEQRPMPSKYKPGTITQTHRSLARQCLLTPSASVSKISEMYHASYLFLGCFSALWIVHPGICDADLTSWSSDPAACPVTSGSWRHPRKAQTGSRTVQKLWCGVVLL